MIEALDVLVRAGELPEGLDFANVTVEPPRDPLHGDMATNAAMVLAKPSGQKPRDIALKLAEQLMSDGRNRGRRGRSRVFKPAPRQRCLAGVIGQVLNMGQQYGTSSMGIGLKVNVEYVSANPTGPLHVGHTRGAVFGDALAGLLAFQDMMTREYYINDGGAQVDVLARSVYLRYLEAHGQQVAFEDGTYPGDYLIPVGEALKMKVGDAYVGKGEQFWLSEIREFATDQMMMLIREDLASLGITMDKFFSEKSLFGTGVIEKTIEGLRQDGLIYEGVLEPPKGKTPEDWEPGNKPCSNPPSTGMM